MSRTYRDTWRAVDAYVAKHAPYGCLVCRRGFPTERAYAAHGCVRTKTDEAPDAPRTLELGLELESRTEAPRGHVRASALLVLVALVVTYVTACAHVSGANQVSAMGTYYIAKPKALAAAKEACGGEATLTGDEYTGVPGITDTWKFTYACVHPDAGTFDGGAL